MTLPANERLLDRAIDREIDVRRYSNGVIARMVAILNKSDARLAAQLTEALMQLDRNSFTVARLETLLASVRDLNTRAYADVMQAVGPEISALAKAESAAAFAQFRVAVPAAVQLRLPLQAVAWEAVYSAAMSRPFQGRLLRDWMGQLEEGRAKAIREAIRQGIVEGQTTADIIRRIRGTKALRFEDGILNRGRRELATIVQTALSHTAQTARQAVVDSNADLVKAVRWVSTLDSRTSAACRVRDGLLYSADKHTPQGHKIPWGDGPGRLHFNCRSVSVPVLKSWRELGIPLDDLPASTRASMNGQVPAELTYKDWFARQSFERQVDIVGTKRAELFRAGKVTFDRFTDNKGRWLTLAQLNARL